MTRRRIGAHLADLCAGIIAIVTFAVTFATVVTPVEAYAADTPPTPKLEKSVQLGDGDDSLMTVTKDGKFAAVRDDDTINFINIDSGEKKQAAYSASKPTFAVTEDQKTLFVADSDAGTLTAYDVRSGKATALSGGSVADIHSMQVSKDGRQLALVSDTDSGYHVQIYDINGRKVTVTRDMGDVDDLLVSNDMTTVYTVNGSTPTIEATALKDGTVKYTKAVDESGNWGLNRFSLDAQLDNGTL